MEQANTLTIKGQRDACLHGRVRVAASLEEKVLEENGIVDNAHLGVLSALTRPLM